MALVSLALAGCGGSASLKTSNVPSQAQVEAVKARADAASADVDREAGRGSAAKAAAGAAVAAPTGTVAPGEEDAPRRRELESRKGRILGADPVEGCTWVVGESTVVAGEQDSMAQLRASAEEQAAAAAVQDFLGVDVRSKFMDYQQEGLRHEVHLVESLLQTTRNGHIIDQKILESGYGDASDCSSCRYHLKLKACVLPLDSTRDKEFRVDVQVSRARFVQGDEAKIEVTATRDCSVYLYDVYDLGSNNKTALVVPNEAVPAKTLKAGETWAYPDEDAKKRGVRLVAELPKKTDEVSAETILVVATKTPLPAAVYDPTDGGYLGVMRRLYRSSADWETAAAAYTIYNR